MFLRGADENVRPQLHLLHPSTKLVWLLAISVAALVCRSPGRLVVTLGLLWVTSAVFGVSLGALRRVTRLSLPFCLALLLVQIALRHEGPVAVSLGGFAIHHLALQAGLLGMLRVQCLAIAGAQFWLWLHPTDLALMLVAWRVPYRYAFLPTVAFRAFPLLGHELERVLDGQQLRGLELGRSWAQVIHFPRLVIPFCLRTLRVGSDMALAMELRGYGAHSQRTSLRYLRARWWDYVLVVLLLAAIAYLLLERLVVY